MKTGAKLWILFHITFFKILMWETSTAKVISHHITWMMGYKNVRICKFAFYLSHSVPDIQVKLLLPKKLILSYYRYFNVNAISLHFICLKSRTCCRATRWACLIFRLGTNPADFLLMLSPHFLNLPAQYKQSTLFFFLLSDERVIL